MVYIAPQISAAVQHVNVKDFQQVSAGELLFELDPANYQTAYDQANARYQQALQQNQASDDSILAASAQINSSMAELTDAQSDYRRGQSLVTQGAMSVQRVDELKARLQSAQAAVDRARALLQQQIKAQGAKGTEAPAVKQAAAVLSQASLNLSYTQISAPRDGYLGEIGVRPGSIVSPGTAMVPLVESDTFWVAANYKESVIGTLQAGMKATVVLDMYPKVQFTGKVSAISPASGAAFSLLPSENATGNWVKISQRFPVRIAITPASEQPPLRIGASATVTIDVVNGP